MIGAAGIGLLCALVVAGYFATNRRYVSETPTDQPGDQYYNLLVRGFDAGRLDLPVAVPPGLAALADPLDPDSNAEFRRPKFAAHRLHDMTYFEGKLYLYFGVTPALVAFWPYHVLTGGFLSQQTAVRVFCSLGFLAGVWTLLQLRRACFPQIPSAATAIGIVGFAACVGAAPWLRRPEVYEVAASCAFAFTMLAAGFLWRALAGGGRAALNTACASIALGLATGARPTILPLAPVLLIPALRRAVSGGADTRRKVESLVVWAVIPLACIALGLAAYNQLRFHDPFEFGQRYQLAGDRQDVPHFSTSFIPFHAWMYFLAPLDWAAPVARAIVPDSIPRAHGDFELPFGILTNTPFTLVAVLAFIPLRGEPDARRALRWYAGLCLGAVVIASAVILSFYFCCGRYEFEFASFLGLLACVGSWAVLESQTIGRRMKRIALVCTAFAAIHSAAVCWLMSAVPRDEEENRLGLACREAGNPAAARMHFERAIQLCPNYGEAHMNLGVTWLEMQDGDRAVGEFVLASHDPEVAGAAAGSVGVLLHGSGRTAEALPWFERAMRHNDAPCSTYFAAARAYLELNMAEDAIRTLAHGEAIAKTDGWRHFFHGCSLALSGNPDGGRAEYGIARKLQPSLPQIVF